MRRSSRHSQRNRSLSGRSTRNVEHALGVDAGPAARRRGGAARHAAARPRQPRTRAPPRSCPTVPAAGRARPRRERVLHGAQHRREVGVVPHQHRRHVVVVDPVACPPACRPPGVKSVVKNRSLFSRREAIRMKMRKAVSLNPNPAGGGSAYRPDREVDVLDRRRTPRPARAAVAGSSVRSSNDAGLGSGAAAGGTRCSAARRARGTAGCRRPPGRSPCRRSRRNRCMNRGMVVQGDGARVRRAEGVEQVGRRPGRSATSRDRSPARSRNSCRSTRCGSAVGAQRRTRRGPAGASGRRRRTPR